MDVGRVWYYRDFRAEELVGPFFYGVANAQARLFSKENVSGLAEVITQGVVYLTYVRGRQALRGRAAAAASSNNRPPSL
jgi:hypothetical protein